MAFNQGNNPNAMPPQQDPNQMTLGELEQCQDMPPEVKSRAQAARTEMTISIGCNALDCLDICGSSKLWHRHQNEMAQFSGGMHQTLYHSYFGNFDGGALEGPNGGAQYLFKVYPNIRSLNVILNLASGTGVPWRNAQRDALIHSFYRLCMKYGRQLVCFKLWVRAELCVDNDYYEKRPHPGRWYSVISREFFPTLRGVLEHMSAAVSPQCQVLWLDMMEVAQPVPPDVAMVGPPQVVKLADLLEDCPRALAKLAQFAEFRFAANYIDPFAQGVNGRRRHSVLYNRLAPIGTLQRIHFRYPISAEEWLTVPQDVARRFQENDITFGQPFSQLVDLFYKFNALNRVAIFVSRDGPRFGAIFQALTQVANLQVLELTIYQACLFSPEEVQHSHSQSGTLVPTQARLLALQVLAIVLHLSMRTCADITVAPLFPAGNRAAARQLNANPLPSLITFDMEIREGECQACDNQDQCIRQAVIQWFKPGPNASPGPIASVFYSNESHPALGCKHGVYWRAAQ